MNPLWLIYHVPKTGGQTIRDAVVQQVGHGDRFFHLGPWGSRQTGIGSTDDIAELAASRRDRISIIAGHPVDHQLHAMFTNRRIREVVILRHPAERIVSSFNFFASHPPTAGELPRSFDEWYRQRYRPDMVVGWLAKRIGASNDPGDVASRLAACTVVGRTPNLSRIVPLLLRAMGLAPAAPTPSNVTGTHHPRILTLDGQLRERLTRDNPGDTMLYHLARPLEHQSLRRLEAWATATSRRRNMQ